VRIGRSKFLTRLRVTAYFRASSAVDARLMAPKIGADKDIPHLLAALLDMYVSDLHLLGLV